MKSLVVDKSRTPEIYENIMLAVEDLGHPTILTYRPDLVAENRAKAISHHIIEDNKPPFARKQGSVERSYDEYRFACTAEGGADSRVAAVPKAEQNIQGGQLAALCRTLRSGEQFQVKLLPDPF